LQRGPRELQQVVRGADQRPLVRYASHASKRKAAEATRLLHLAEDRPSSIGNSCDASFCSFAVACATMICAFASTAAWQL
jgi:hypothetical protein